MALALIAAVLALMGTQHTARAQEQASLGVELSMVEGSTYDHAIGGGTWGDGPGGAPGDVWDEQQWPPTYACGDVVSFMLLVTSDSITGVDPAPRTVDVDLELDAATTGPDRTGAGYSSFLGATVLPEDPGAMTDGDSNATILNPSLQGLYEVGGTLTGTIRLTGVEVGERIITRVDVRATCSDTIPHAGQLYGQLLQNGNGESGFREVAPDGPRDLGAGQNLVQMVQVNGEPLAPAEPPTTTPPVDPPVEPPVTTPPVTSPPSTVPPTSPPTTSGGGNAEVALDKTLGSVVDVDGSGTNTAGDRVDYQLLVTNTGDLPLSGVVVIDGKPGTTTPVCPGLVGGALAVGTSVTCTVSYTLTGIDLANGQVANTASVDTDQTGPVTDTLVVPIAPPNVLSVSKIADRSSVVVGGTIRYTITVTNNSGQALTNVVVDDDLADFQATLATLAAGDSRSYSVVYTTTPADQQLGSVTNTVTVTSDQLDPVRDQAQVTVLPVTVTGVSVLPSGPISLPRTGTDTGQALLWSLAFIAAGLSLLTAARGRRQLDQLN